MVYIDLEDWNRKEHLNRIAVFILHRIEFPLNLSKIEIT